ncbi:helix-turn-helix transcriptional regulator [Sphingomonas sp. H39-1-10]|uniref:helix-turn-helix domain-containing protein n=1 Tax=Sphingomonas pollutisoli TaxID=3030829 RepID=UPI0023B94361|nr:helix-turn-helix transcriptional regulator [Sphingomonas pollutisoli]MDF0491406.1 helix-turn-helix transcriptional regulator [Sphingomonas pollutisoli]
MPTMTTQRARTIPRTYSRHSREAVAVLGQLIRIHRIERAMSLEELATRAGISRDMLRRVEHGDPRCGIGLVFEAAAIVGVPLFESGRDALAARLAGQEEKLRLLPKAVRKPRSEVKDDF